MKDNRKPTILLGNDDGFRAGGIRALAEVLSTIANVVIVAPEDHKSAFSSALSSSIPVRLRKRDCDIEGVELYTVTGTPADCGKIAFHTIFKDNKPDLVVSGCNHGLNDAIAVIYSGTIAFAIEGAIAGIPSLAVSLDDLGENPDFTEVKKYALDVVKRILDIKIPKFTVLSLNLPKGEVKGLKICRQTVGRFVEEFAEGKDGFGSTVYWMSGYQIDQEPERKGDFAYIKEGYATLTPLKLDITNYDYLDELESLF